MPNDTRPPAGDPEVRQLLMDALGVRDDVSHWPLNLLLAKVKLLRDDNRSLAATIAQFRRRFEEVPR